ncbi:hypothetical protein I4U23_011508 [Adineta vaga]|nr:hypothetical protein I4U23_011508 [Adineta vaga]
MLPVRKLLIYCVLLHLSFARSQINLDLTDKSDNIEDDVVWQHDCLHKVANVEHPKEPIQIISYCLNESPSKWNIQENHLDQNFTFSKLSNLKITSQQLYLWSAPMDIIEHYQFYLNQLTNSEIISLSAEQTFYNLFDLPINQFIIACIDKLAPHIMKPLPVRKSIFEPTFEAVDVRCTFYDRNSITFTRSCESKRNDFLVASWFSDIPKTISEICWNAYLCYFEIGDRFQQKCRDFCPTKQICQEIIYNNSCPDTLFIPNIPLFFGHIYLAYTKPPVLTGALVPIVPTYVCYNDQLCGGFLPNKTLITFNNFTCRRSSDFPFHFNSAGRVWLDIYVKPLQEALYKCNTIIRESAKICNSSIMYQCINSSKCISYHRVGDIRRDCDYHDDEEQSVINDICLKDHLNSFFKCTTPKGRCINKIKVADGTCQCETDEYDLCDDENPNLHYIRKHISFPTICDGMTDLIPVLIDGQNYTDETECELWQCNNIYTRCNDVWNCFNGADEVDCSPSPLLNCSQQQHICVSPQTYQLMCLPLEKANDGKIDCLGGTDEPKLCRLNNYVPTKNHFFCPNINLKPCVEFKRLCFSEEHCNDDDRETICSRNGNSTVYTSFYSRICEFDQDHSTDVDMFLCQQSYDINQIRSVNFTLNTTTIANKHNNIQHSTMIKTINEHKQRCHRGLPLLVWVDKDKNLTNITCLCPPSYYGDKCQYQNQRIALTIKLQTYSDSQRTLFSIFVSLIDNSNERIIHSYHQFTFLYVRDCHFTYNIYLLYSNRPKNNLKNYSVHIDVYEKTPLNYQGSLQIPIQFPFLPVYRIATLLNIPHTNEDLNSCSNQPCVHGRCMKYSHDPEGSTFCHCNKLWSGRYCNISHICTCSNDSICIGVTANNRSICICPIDKFGSRCLLSNIVCQSNPCANDGKCIPIDEHLIIDKSYSCMCPKGFSGNRCEIPDTKMILSFSKDIILSQSIVIHFIQVMNNTEPENGSTFITIPIHQKTVIINWTYPFHIAFMKLSNNTYYLITSQKPYTSSSTMLT